MKIEYEGDPIEDRPEAYVERFAESKPVAYESGSLGSNADRLVWEYDSPPNSRWFDKGKLLKLEPGEYTEFQSHRSDVEGDYELTFRVFYGPVRLRTEYWDETLGRFDTGVVPADTAYQFANTGTETAWIGVWATVGEDDLADASRHRPGDRPGAQAEYERIKAARAERDLPVEESISHDGDPNEDRPEAEVAHFSEMKPKAISLAPEVGNNAPRTDWFTGFSTGTYFTHNTVVKLEPGEHIVFHSHFKNEGPYEEIYWPIEGEFTLRTEYWDTKLDQFDWAFLPTGTAHSVGNVGTDTAWFVAVSTQGGVERDDEDHGVFDNVEPSERETVVEEYKRIMAARKKRGLSIPMDVDVEILDEE